MNERVQTDIMKVAADAAFNVALRHRGTMTERQVAETLIMVADHYPDIIEDEIARLNARCKMLRGYLPARPAAKDEA